MDPQQIRETVSAFQRSRIVLTAYELDVFTFIGKDSPDSGNIAKGLRLNRNAAERLLNALVALDLLEKNNGCYNNTRESFMLLSKDSPAYMAGFMHTNHLWNTWSHLTEVVKTGKAARDTEINDRGSDWLEAFINAMHDRGKKQAPGQVAGIDLEGVGSILDVGGGSGCFCMAFLDRKPGIKAAVFDLPNVVPISKKIVEEEGFTGSISHFTGDYTTDDLPMGFDLLFLSAVIHSNSFKTNRKLVKNCYNALNPNGKIVIQDWIMNDARTSPVQGAIFSINMLVGVEGGDCYSEKEVKSWLTDAGFSGIKISETATGIGQVTGVKK